MDFVKDYLAHFESYASLQLVGKEPTTLYQPIEYIMGMKAKRFRPLSFKIWR